MCYALYSIFKEERSVLRYNKVSTSINLRKICLTKFLLYIWNDSLIVVMVTQEIAGSCDLFWINEIFLNTKINKNSRKCREFHYTNSISLQGAIILHRRDKISWKYCYLKEQIQTFTLTWKMNGVLFFALRNSTVATTFQMTLVHVGTSCFRRVNKLHLF